MVKAKPTEKQIFAYNRKVRLEDLRHRLLAKIFETEEQQRELDKARDLWHEAIENFNQAKAQLDAAKADCNNLRDQFESSQEEMTVLLAERNSLSLQLVEAESK